MVPSVLKLTVSSGKWGEHGEVILSGGTPNCGELRGCGYGGGIGPDDGSGLFGRAFGLPLIVKFMPDSPTRPLMLLKNSSLEIGVMTMEVRFDVARDPDVFE
uniref:Uncharacterized protein n=1 Tax=Echinococcus granulosus TaxID=6210 RepID=A0A068X2K9_ECHGR|nr:hypothetical protein EgrG_002053800 [Echinococcus granulosus]